ncbi:TetR/AcrR family transcriptional regulator [Hoyosella sp. G463]|uniref:TetR/AcrR family transcriptional regulator n=1 Tax=Lolliginicoccus lacisalsi TaxID=2742202 RepID=A0A927J9W0_9ACTN|nr:TetR/AcrR family transcriptional regulator [Lolliginicoccus lacisalsi]MBD8505171.1 TetR/AcrR family transcriptional regulator [Lolliginicoccus lacisalsi]
MATAGTKGVPRPERERQILDVAAQHIGRVGYAGLSLAEIAHQAGGSKPLVYGYFGTKDGLYTACVERAATILAEAIEQAITSTASLEMAQHTLDALFAALEPRPHDWNVLFDRSAPRGGPAGDAVRIARRRIAHQAAQGIATVFDATGITDPNDLSALTDVWMGAVTSLVNWWLRHPEQTAAEMSARSKRLIDALATVQR